MAPKGFLLMRCPKSDGAVFEETTKQQKENNNEKKKKKTDKKKRQQGDKSWDFESIPMCFL